MQNNIVLNEGQQLAVKKALFWYNVQTNKKYFSIAGSAGTGKSTIVSTIIRELGLDPKLQVCYATPTGKAALVLRLKGSNASTIHRLIYKPEIIKIPILDKDGNPKKDKQGNIKYKFKVTFHKRDRLENLATELFLIDEGSMVGDRLWEDLLAFNKRIIILSDQKQLPPVGGKIIDPVKNPDITLTEVMRQTSDSDILVAAIKATTGELIKNELSYRRYEEKISFPNKDVHIISHHHLTDNLLKRAELVLCGKNDTREKLNKYIRENIHGFSGTLPQKGDKLICRRNNHEKFLPSNTDVSIINGLIGYVEDHIDLESMTNEIFKMNFRPEFLKDDMFYDLDTNYRLFKNVSKEDPSKPLSREERDNIMNFGKGEKFEYGYCLTTHLAQGSEANTVIVFFEWMGDFENVCKWLYTAITRAKKKLIIVRSLPKGEIPYWESEGGRRYHE